MRYFILSFFLLLAELAATAQDIDNESVTDPNQFQVDSLLALITPDTPDTLKARYYCIIGEVSGIPDTVIKYSNLSLDNCDKSDLVLISDNYDYLSWAHYMKGEPKNSLFYSFKELSCLEELDNKPDIANCFIGIAKNYFDLNFRDSTFYYFNKAIDLYTELKDSSELSYTYRSIGIANNELGFYQTAEEYFTRAMKLDSATNNYLYLSNDYQYLGTVVKDKQRALTYLKKSLFLLDSIQDNSYYYTDIKYGTYQELASIYMKLAKETNQKEYADSSYIYVKKIGNKLLQLGEYLDHIITCEIYADYLSFCGKNKEALNVLLECEKYLDDDARNLAYAEYFEHLSEIYTNLGDYKSALDCYVKMHKYKTEFTNDSTLNMLAGFQTEQAVKIHEAEKRQLESETRRLKTVRTSLIIGLALILILVLNIFRALRIKHKSNMELLNKNRMLDQQNSEIIAQREEIENQRDVITKQWHEVDNINKKLIDSINYARRIQNAAISSKTEINKIFPQNFVFYRPCDIVSGDFYHVTQCGKYQVLVTADCTGHGIPGAFLSMLGISALKEFCVTEDDAANPGLILDNMRNFIKTTLATDTDYVIDDGMDMTICSFDIEAMELRYAIANQTAVIVRDGKSIKLEGDRMPVGRYMIEKEHFTTHTQPIMKGDTVYCFSDGIQDQLGGDLSNKIGEKYLRKNLLNLLTANCDKPLDAQCRIIDETITAWRNGRQQVDDMTLIGIRV